MSRLSSGISRTVSTGIFGGIALTLTFGAVQFASGRDLGNNLSKDIANPSSMRGPEAGYDVINRDAKADRAARPAALAKPMKTISFQLNGLPDTSVLLRLPMTGEAANGAAVTPATSVGGKPTLACEPVVSVLTAVAKQLQPGRCVT